MKLTAKPSNCELVSGYIYANHFKIERSSKVDPVAAKPISITTAFATNFKRSIPAADTILKPADLCHLPAVSELVLTEAMGPEDNKHVKIKLKSPEAFGCDFSEGYIETIAIIDYKTDKKGAVEAVKSEGSIDHCCICNILQANPPRRINHEDCGPMLSANRCESKVKRPS